LSKVNLNFDKNPRLAGRGFFVARDDAIKPTTP